MRTMELEIQNLTRFNNHLKIMNARHDLQIELADQKTRNLILQADFNTLQFDYETMVMAAGKTQHSIYVDNGDESIRCRMCALHCNLLEQGVSSEDMGPLIT